MDPSSSTSVGLVEGVLAKDGHTGSGETALGPVQQSTKSKTMLEAEAGFVGSFPVSLDTAHPHPPACAARTRRPDLLPSVLADGLSLVQDLLISNMKRMCLLPAQSLDRKLR